MPTLKTYVERTQTYTRVNNNIVTPAVRIDTTTPLSFSLKKGVDRGGPVPGYKGKIARGESATSTLSAVGYTFRPGAGRIIYSRIEKSTGKVDAGSLIGSICIPDLGGLPTSPLVGFSSPNNQALASYISAANSAMSSFDGAVFVGELRETIHGLRHPLQSLIRGMDHGYLDALRKKRQGLKSNRRSRMVYNTPSGLSRRKKVVADTWLEWSFAWKPLIADVNDAYHELVKTVHKVRPEFKRIKGTGKDEIVSKDFTTGNASLVSDLTTYYDRVSTASVRYYGNVRVHSPYLGTAQARDFGFRLDRFVPTLWELIPFSFLVDYFTNIGDIVSAASFATSNITWTNKATKWSHKFVRTRDNFQPYSHPFYVTSSFGHSGNHILETYGKDRVPVTGSLVPSLEFTIPGLGSLKWLNIGALLSNSRSFIPF